MQILYPQSLECLEARDGAQVKRDQHLKIERWKQEELSMKKRPRNAAESRKAGMEPAGSSKEQDSGIQGHLTP